MDLQNASRPGRALCRLEVAHLSVTDGEHQGDVAGEQEGDTGDEAAATIARCFGTPVRYEAVAAEDWPAYMTEKWGLPPALAASTVGTMRAIEAGQFDLVTDDYRSITGRSPQTLDEFLEGVRKARPSVA